MDELTKELMKEQMNKDEPAKVVLSGVEWNRSCYTSVLKWWCRKGKVKMVVEELFCYFAGGGANATTEEYLLLPKST